MKEDFLQYIWQYQLFDKENLTTVSIEKLEIINQGTINYDAGPDFFNGKIKIDDTIWAGNIEIHLKSSDWHKHHHENDDSYDSIILHVVAENDAIIKRKNGQLIPTFILPINKKLITNFNELTTNSVFPACTPYLNFIPQVIQKQQINRTSVERLERKTSDIAVIVKETKNDWAFVLYHFLGKYFGSKINSQPFEMVTQNLPLTYLAKHKNNLLQIEAMLFGVAGFLDNRIEKVDEYYLALQKEWQFLSAKFQLNSISASVWKFSKLRPANFPTVRLAQFAAIIFNSSHLFSKILETNELTKIKSLFSVKPSDYWNTHYQFLTQSINRKKIPGEQFINSLIINVVIPITFAYGKYNNNNELKNKALEWLEQLPPEKNTITEKYKLAGFQIETAFISQGLLTLYENYCSKLNCLNCLIGHKIIKRINE